MYLRQPESKNMLINIPGSDISRQTFRVVIGVNEKYFNIKFYLTICIHIFDRYIHSTKQLTIEVNFYFKFKFFLSIECFLYRT